MNLEGEEGKTSDPPLSRLLAIYNESDETTRREKEQLTEEIGKSLETVNGRKAIDKELIGSNGRALGQLINAIQSLPSDPILVVFLAVLEAFVIHSNVRSKRLRKLARLDATSALIRAMRMAFKDGNAISETSSGNATIARLADVLLIVAVKDRKLALKLRMSGILMSIFEEIFSPTNRRENQYPLLRLVCRAVRSPRNAQQIAKKRGNLTEITRLLGEYQRDDQERSFSASEPLLYALARLLECTFLIAKNKKARTHLAHEATRIVHEIWHYNLNERNNSIPEVRDEVSLVATGVLRLLVKNKKSKELLVQWETVRICEELVTRGPEKFAADDPIQAQLQESLCGLCLRCMPNEVFPISAATTFPYSLALPNGERRRSLPRTATATATSKRRVVSTGSIGSAGADELAGPDGSQEAFLASSEDLEDLEEEDVGEEDEFLSLLASRDLRRLKGENFDSTLPIGADDEETAAEKDKPQVFTRQEAAELRENYSSAFSEFERGAPLVEAPSQVSQPSQPSQAATHSEAIRAETMTTRSVIRFVKIAYPDLCGPDIDLEMQPLKSSSAGVRTILTSQLAHSRIRNEFERRIVYSLDAIADVHSTADVPRAPLGNDDTQRVGRGNPSIDHLLFESRFEAGNLRMATMVGPNHYELILSPDINQTRDHFQWFYFEISNNRANVPYTFEIVNCLKPTSMFGHGMQPVMFSVSEALDGRPGWVRAGQQIHYYRNLYTMHQENDENSNKKPSSAHGHHGCFYTTRFTVSFRHNADVIYIAYHFPYTYSHMKTVVHRHLLTANREGCSIRGDVIGHSLAGNPVHVLTITATGSQQEIQKREIILLMSRVHPGESNASWMMHGILDALTANNRSIRADLLSRFIFKVIPMLNPDGVINGSHRCSLAGVDLNRVWDRPTKARHPEIFHAKGLVQYMVEVLERRPFCIVDLHGHSRKMNVFMYGNNPSESWRLSDRNSASEALPSTADFRFLPEILDKIAPGFSLKCCRFSITKAKEPSARVALWRQFSLSRVYTIESTYCGFDLGKYHGYQIGVFELKEMGAKLVASLAGLRGISKRNGVVSPKDEENQKDEPQKSAVGRSRSRSAQKSTKRAAAAQSGPKIPQKHKSILDI